MQILNIVLSKISQTQKYKYNMFLISYVDFRPKKRHEFKRVLFWGEPSRGRTAKGEYDGGMNLINILYMHVCKRIMKRIKVF
jgi:hypothetical protein